jgi:hypothetical protein
MADLQRTFLAGRMNKDLDERLIPDGEYRDAVNITIDTSEGSSVGAVQNAFGNTQLNIPQNILASMGVAISNDLSTIGAVTYEAQSLLYWFVVGSDFEGIFEYNQETQITSLILGCTDGQLGFTKNNLITGVNYITDGKGSGLLVWNDNKNEPRKINISRARTYSVDDPRIDIDINLIVKPPLNAPYIKLSTLASPNLIPNNIEDKFVYFSYRYKYADNEYSSMSPFSAVAFDPKVLQIDSQTGENKGMLNKFNQVELSFETGNEFVKEIQLLVWESRTLNVRIIDNLDKSELNIPDNAVESFYFMNNKTYAALPSDQTTRLFDNVPLKALAQDVIGSRLVMGNYVQFRDLVNSAGMIDINYVVDYIPDPIPVTVDPKQTWRSDRDYEIGIAYLDDYGRMTTVLTTSSDNTDNNQSNSVYIPAENSDTANSLRVTIKNKAPEWATGYRFFVKQSKGEYYNIFPTTFLRSGSYRYFLINESDRDKIKVNGYIIFKSFNNGATNTNKRFKVLELEQKPVGFIAGALEGLYFKIKADASDTFLNVSAQQNFNFNGSGRGLRIPVFNRSLNIDTSYYSYTGDNTIIPTTQDVTASFVGPLNSESDFRINVEILPNDEFRWTSNLALSTWSSNIPIPFGGTYTLSSSSLGMKLGFANAIYNVGDRWVFNVRGDGSTEGTPSYPYTGYGLPGTATLYGGGAILKGPGVIFPGASIEINILFDSNPNNPTNGTGVQSFISNNYYKNLEEWFYESGAYASYIQYNQSGTNIGSRGVTFRYGTNYQNTGNPLSNQINQSNVGGDIYMIIQGFGTGSGSNLNEIKASLKVTQTPISSRISAETVPSNDDTDIYYELSRTHKIENGNHLSLWRYDASTVIGSNSKLTQNGNKEPHYFEAGQTVYITASNIPAGTPFTVVSAPDRYSILINYVVPSNQSGGVSNNDFDQDQTSALNPAIVVLNNPTNKNSDYNAYCYGNGVESNRILDTYNEPWLKYSLRASTVIEDYEQQIKDASLTYSGLYQWSSSINRLNEFNLSTANFKNLDKNFGSVQKIYARTTDLLVLHQNKITSVLYGKNLLVDAVGGGTVASVPEVLGTQIAYPYEFGISSNPESFAVWGDTMYFADSKRGAVLKMTNDQVLEVSRVGMSDYFRDLMKANPQNAKLGAYDPYNHNYVIASTTIRNTPCDITINPTVGSVAHNTAGSLEYMFSISGTTSWFIQLISIGFGTSWIELPPYCQTGVGSQDIYARVQNNLATVPRSVAFRVHYCSSYVDYILTQGIGKKIDFNILTFGKNE